MQHVVRNSGQSKERSRYSAWLVAGFGISVAIALATVLRRLTALVHPSTTAPEQMRSLDAVFSSHAVLTCFHIVPAAVFVCLSVVFVFRRNGGGVRETLLYPIGALTGVTAYLMSTYAVGGWVERSAVLVFNTWFLISLAMSFRFRLRDDAAAKRRWMVRAIGVLLGVATARPVMGVFFATRARTHLEPSDFFGFAFWIGFSINALITEALLRNAAIRSGEPGLVKK